MHLHDFRNDEIWQNAVRLLGGKLNEAKQSGLTADKDSKALLVGAIQAVQIEAFNGGGYSLVFADDNKPAYDVLFDRDGCTIEVTYSGDKLDCPSLEDQLALVKRLSVGPPSIVPFGWVADGLVTDLLYTGEIVLDNTIHRIPGIGNYLLEGTELPQELHLPVSSTDDDTKDWCERFKNALTNGKIVRLKPYMVGRAWGIGKGERDVIRFERSGTAKVRFATDRPYVFHHPNGRFVGQSESGWETYKKPLEHWFKD